jgi:hypothetical protein
MKTAVIVVLAVVLAAAAYGISGQSEVIKDARATTRGWIDGQVAYNERGSKLGQYRDGKTYMANGSLFGYGNLLSALVVDDAQRRGIWK